MSKLPFILKSSLRYWIHRPWTALTGIALLAIGTFAVSSLWVVTNTLVRQPLPYPQSEQLFGIQSVDEKIGKFHQTLSIADLRDFKKGSTAFEAIVGYRGDFLNYKTHEGVATQLFGTRVTPDFAKVFQMTPHMGRLFGNEDFASSQASTVLIGYDCWQRVFNADPELIGKSVQFNEKPYEVIGILPRSFREPGFADAWLPFPEGSPEYFVRDSRYWNAIGRLADKATVKQASDELKTIAESLAKYFPNTNKNRSIRLLPLNEILTGDFEKPLLIMFIAVCLVLIATCMNLANLQMMSGLQRNSEIATRLALGEIPSTLFFRTLFESITLCVLGCGAGLLMTQVLIQRIDTILPPFFLPRVNEIHLAGSDVLTIGLIILGCSISFGLLPAFQAVWASPFQRMKTAQSRSSLSKESKRIRWAFLSLQVGIAVSILMAAVLLRGEYQRLKQLELGFDEKNLISIAASPNESQQQNFAALGNYFRSLEEWLATQPGITSATSSSSPPLWGFSLESAISINGRDLVTERDTPATAVYDSVGTHFFDTMKIKLLTGREFNISDARDAAPVAIVNRKFVDTYFPNEDPIGKEILILPWMQPKHRRIIGIAPNIKDQSLTADAQPRVYVPAIQSPWLFTTFLVRHRGNAEAMGDQLKRALEQREPGLGVTIITMDELLQGHLAKSQIMMMLLTAFGVIVAILSIFGVASLSAFNTCERMVEWGIRLALGGTPSQVRGIVVRDLLLPLGSGLILGLVGFALSARLAGADLASFGGSEILSVAYLVAGLALICLTTTWILSSSITRLQPTTILKSL